MIYIRTWLWLLLHTIYVLLCTFCWVFYFGESWSLILKKPGIEPVTLGFKDDDMHISQSEDVEEHFLPVPAPWVFHLSLCPWREELQPADPANWRKTEERPDSHLARFYILKLVFKEQEKHTKSSWNGRHHQNLSEETRRPEPLLH